MRDLILQTYYLGQPETNMWGEDEDKNLWVKLYDNLEDLSNKEFKSLYLPPPYKGLDGQNSNGFNVHDHFDLGEYTQKSLTQDNDKKATKYGTRQELEELINKAHQLDIKVYTDLILTRPPVETQSDINISLYTKNELYKKWINWLVDELNFDGFRVDMAKKVDKELLSYVDNLDEDLKIISEYWIVDTGVLKNYLSSLHRSHLAIDFPLFYKLRDMCDNPFYDMRNFDNEGILNTSYGEQSLLFVESHDTDDFSPIIKNKIRAYAYILFHHNSIRIFSKDYYNYGLGEGIQKIIEFTSDLPKEDKQVMYSTQDVILIKRGEMYLVINNSKDTKKVPFENNKEFRSIGSGEIKEDSISINGQQYLMLKEVS